VKRSCLFSNQSVDLILIIIPGPVPNNLSFYHGLQVLLQALLTERFIQHYNIDITLSKGRVMMKSDVNLTVQALQRLPYYLQHLRKVDDDGVQVISATTMANVLDLNEVLVRKDLALICTTKGKPKTGFLVRELIENIEDYLGYNNTMDAVLVGVGSLGKALLGNNEFSKFGLNIVAAFEIDEDIIGQIICGKKVFSADKLQNLCERMHIHIGIIAVPPEFAQDVADKLVSSGIRAIWNFALVKLNVPQNVLVQNENLAASLAVLSQHLRNEMSENTGVGVE
jgi:redox-sensing transcriptional repressor